MRDRSEIAAAFGTIGLQSILTSLILTSIGLLLSSQAWRLSIGAFWVELRGPPARSVFFVTQLGKYLPGGLWGVAGQVDAARSLGVDRAKVGLGALVFLLLHLLTGLLAAVVTLAWTAPDVIYEYRWVLSVTAPFFLLLVPSVLTSALSAIGRLLNRWTGDLQLRFQSIVAAIVWLGATWICYGLALAVLAQPLTDPAPAPALIALSLGGFALAWSVGVLVLLAPSGIGPREIVIYLVLLRMLDPADATAIAITCRLVHVAADLALGLSGLRGYRALGRAR